MSLAIILCLQEPHADSFGALPQQESILLVVLSLIPRLGPILILSPGMRSWYPVWQVEMEAQPLDLRAPNQGTAHIVAVKTAWQRRREGLDWMEHVLELLVAYCRIFFVSTFVKFYK